MSDRKTPPPISGWQMRPADAELPEDRHDRLSIGEGVAMGWLFAAVAAIAVGVSVWWALGAFVAFAGLLAMASSQGAAERGKGAER